MPLTKQAQAFLDFIAQQKPPGWEELTPAQGREAFGGLTDLFGDGPEIAHVEDRTLLSCIGVRIYSDADQSNGERLKQPAVMFFHGGGWVLGNVGTHDALCRRIAKASGCTLISVDYSLSPEARFPIALQECYRATQYVAEHSDEFGVRPASLAVAGDSAGGNLAASVAIKARDEDGPSIQLQVLIYPVIEPNFETESYQQFAVNHGLSKATMQYFWQQYLGDESATPLSAPSRTSSLADLPAAHVVTAEYDVLRVEGEAYAAKLAEAGVPTTSRR
jgi:acetyl esterase